MLESPGSFPAEEAARRLHERLRDPADRTATGDFADAILYSLILWLQCTFPRSESMDCAEAASDTIWNLCKHPDRYRPDRGELIAYLRMSAVGDLKNVEAKTRCRTSREISLESVEHSPEAGKYLGQEVDPSLPLLMAEAQELAKQTRPKVQPANLTAAETAAWALMERGERRTAAYAAALGITDLPVDKQRREVKRVKDRLKKRKDRA